MSEVPQVSVVVPTYNRRDRLRRLAPVLEALTTSGAVEVVIVDDGSTDGTAADVAAMTWAVGVSQPNGGAAAARNAGWRRASAPVVAFLDDDCTPEPAWPLGLLDAFDDPQVVGVGGQILAEHASDLDAYIEVERLVDHGRDGPDGVDYLITANAAYRRAALADVAGFDESFPGAAGEDVDLSWRLRAAGGRLVRSSVAVRHDHRSSVGEIVRTYRGHGRARALLDARHPSRPAGSAAARALSPRTWADHWSQYRAKGVGAVAASGMLVLRAAGLAAFAWGLRQGRRDAG